MGGPATFNLADLFERVVDACADRTALVSGDTRYTFAELDARANRVANALKARGVKAGDHVGQHLYNGHQYVETMIGIFKLRAVPINLNYRYVAAELQYLCDNADLVAAFTEKELAPILADAAQGLPVADHTITIDDDYEDILAAASPERDFEPRSGDDIYIIYTGGTTGMPKGVMWRHEDVFFAGLQGGRPGDENVETPEEMIEYISDPDVALTMLPAAPFIHGAAQWAAWIGIFTGGKLVIQPGRSFDPKRVVELIAEEQITTITLVGDAMARPLADAIAETTLDMESVFALASAGAILSPSVRDRLMELLPDALVLNNFGATETGHQGSAYPGSETGQEGRPSFSMSDGNLVLDEDLKPIAAGSGRIGKLARAGRVPLGYYKDPKKTAERFVTIDGVRYAVPGDMATVEEDGRITVYGRGSNCINTGGEKVFPEEVEEVLKAHPDVYDALVVGIADEKWMQRVVAVVEPRQGKEPSADELDAHCRKSVAGYKVPRQFVMAEQVARQPSGKPDYAWARNLVGGGEA